MSILSRLKVPSFSAGGKPEIDPAKFQLSVGGLTDSPGIYTLDGVKSWPNSTVNARLTSVSGWSVRADWQGVLWRDFIRIVEPLPSASHATFTSHGGGYETTIRLADLDHPRVMLVWAVAGEPLEVEYGGPLRMVVPNLYGYKSAKWLSGIDFVESAPGGYWEDRGYSESGEIETGWTIDYNTMEKRPIPGGEVLDF